MTPDGWAETALEQVAEVAIGRTPARNEKSFWDPGKTTQNRWATIADIQSRYISETSEHISDLGVEHSNARLVPAGTLLMSFKLTLGRAAITSKPMYTNEAIAAFYPNGRTTTEYLYYLLPTLALEESSDRAVKGRTLNKAKLRALRFALPPPAEQRKISAILSSVDDAIEKTQAVIDQVQVVKRGLMQELLTRGLPGRHTRFKQTEIGEIPAEWEVVELASVATVERGKFAYRPRNEPRFYGGEYPFIQTGDVAACDGLITTYSQTLNEEGLAISKLFPSGTIAITIAANIGSTGIAALDVAFPDSLVGIQAGPRIDTRFLELVLRTRKGDLEKLAPESAQKNINLNTLKPLRVPLPGMMEQRQIAESVWSIIKREEDTRQHCDGLKQLKSALMFVLLTGEIRVTPDSAAA